MDYPDIGLDVIAITDNNQELFAYWDGNVWMKGVENDPIDVQIQETVISWKHKI